MKSKDDHGEDIEELKGHEFEFTDRQKAHRCEKIVKKIGQCVGWIHGKEKKLLVVSGKKTILVTEHIHQRSTNQ